MTFPLALILGFLTAAWVGSANSDEERGAGQVMGLTLVFTLGYWLALMLLFAAAGWNDTSPRSHYAEV